MLAGIIGDVIGSVYEAHQWAHRDLALVQSLPIEGNPHIIPLLKKLNWVRKDYSWTDDTLCTVALYSAYRHETDPVTTLQNFCRRYSTQTIGFGKAFNAWVDNPVPYQSFGNGAIMRIGFIPFLPLSLEEKLKIGRLYTDISHNHSDSYKAVSSMIFLCHELQKDQAVGNYNKASIKSFLAQNNFTKTVEQMHQEKVFEMNAMQTLLQSLVIIVESNSFEDVLRNCFYVGGDSDTLACIAANIASCLYPIPQDLWTFSENTLVIYPEIDSLVKDFYNFHMPTHWGIK